MTNCKASALPHSLSGTRLAVSRSLRKERNSVVRLALSRVELSLRGGGEGDPRAGVFLLGLTS